MKVGLDENSQAIWQQLNLESRRYEYELSKDDLVVDVGAYRGEWSTQIYSRFGCDIIMIEPGPWIDGFPIGELINKAASDHDGFVSFGGAYYYSSEFEGGDQKYPCFDIKSFMEEHDEIALMKINIEGGEYAVMKRIIEFNLQARVKNFQIQFHTIVDQPYELWYEEIMQILSHTHYPTYRYPYCWENWRRLDA